MRILNVIGRRPTGGIGSVVKNYQKHLDKDVVFDYLLFSDYPEGPFDSEVKNLGSKVYIVPSLKLKNYIAINSQLNKLFHNIKNNYDIMHIHTVNVAFLVVNKAKKIGLNNIIAHSHATKFSDSKLKSLRNNILCKNLKQMTNYYAACSYEAGEFLFGRNSMINDEVKIIKNAIEIDKYKFSISKRKEFRKELNFDSDDYLIGCIGRLSPQKNLSFALEVFRELVKKNDAKNYKLLIVGEGPELEKLEDLTNKYKINDKVVFMGFRNDIQDILSGIDLFFMPSIYEGLPVIGVEALSSGLPCVFSEAISKEFDSSKSFYISFKNDIEEWSSNLYSISNFPIDRTEVVTNELGYNICEEAKKLKEYYSNIIN